MRLLAGMTHQDCEFVSEKHKHRRVRVCLNTLLLTVCEEQNHFRIRVHGVSAGLAFRVFRVRIHSVFGRKKDMLFSPHSEVEIFKNVFVRVPCICGCPGDQKRVLRPMELELQ
ncbi:hypothetical protein STEG23_028457, partial [Scotinomys teguina]